MIVIIKYVMILLSAMYDLTFNSKTLLIFKINIKLFPKKWTNHSER